MKENVIENTSTYPPMELAINMKNTYTAWVFCSFDYKVQKVLIMVTSSMEVLLEKVLKVKHINGPALEYMYKLKT